jgi:Zn-dependent M28 family amino/carboxypeptidase
VELVLTSGEEVAMIGALEYFKKYRNSWRHKNVYLLNFDSLGSGDIKIITETGNITTVRYDNTLTEIAIRLIRENSRFTDIGISSWHTGDFDSIWFAHAGIPSLTLSAQDENGLIPHLHRPGDTIENVDLDLLPLGTDFSVALLDSLRNETPGGD